MRHCCLIHRAVQRHRQQRTQRVYHRHNGKQGPWERKKKSWSLVNWRVSVVWFSLGVTTGPVHKRQANTGIAIVLYDSSLYWSPGIMNVFTRSMYWRPENMGIFMRNNGEDKELWVSSRDQKIVLYTGDQEM